MELTERLEKSKGKMAELQQKLQGNEQEKQELIKELFRVDGECRVIEEMIKENS